MPNIQIRNGIQSIEEVRKLFIEYSENLGFDLCFQNFDQELERLPGEYSPPSGRILLATDDTVPIGVVALTKIDAHYAEVRRLYVRPAHRARAIGRMLMEAALAEATKIGYRYIRLHTLPVMKTAVALYRSMGFLTIEPYSDNPVEGALFFQLDLTKVR